MTSERPEHQGWATAFMKFSGPWLGQTPPGTRPVEFVPEIFNTDKMSFGTVFSPGGAEFFFGYQRAGTDDVHDILFTQRAGDAWTEPEVLPFNSDVMDGDHCLSADGNRLFWRSWRPLPGETESREWSYLWWSERTAQGWGRAQPLRCGEELQRSGYPAIGRSDTLYVTARGEGGDVSVCRSRWTGDQYGPLEEIVTGMTSGGDMCVAPDESLLVISCTERPENLGKGDLFVSFRRENGTWTPLRHTGEAINTPGENAETHCPMMTPDGKYLLYRVYDHGTKRARVFWVSAEILEGSRSADA
jgi:hypothetical protein